jgi:hypothetical protein
MGNYDLIKNATRYEEIVPETVPEENGATEDHSKEAEEKSQLGKKVPEISKKKEKKKWYSKGKKIQKV